MGSDRQNSTNEEPSDKQDIAFGDGFQAKNLVRKPSNVQTGNYDSKDAFSRADSTENNDVDRTQSLCRSDSEQLLNRHNASQTPSAARIVAEDDKALQVQAWQQQATALAEVHDLGVVGSIFESCLGLFKHLLSSLKTNEHQHNHKERAQSSLGSLFFWGDGFGAASGELDKVLEKSQDLRNMVLSICISIAEVLSEGES